MAEASSFKPEYNPQKHLFVIVPTKGGGEIPKPLNGAWTSQSLAWKAINQWVTNEREKYAKKRHRVTKPVN